MIEKGKVVVKNFWSYKPTLFDSGIGARLPQEYKKFYDEWKNTKPKPVHFIPNPNKWQRNEVTGQVNHVENVPIPGFLTKELHNVFTGGEMIIQGFVHKKNYSPRIPYFWMPVVYRSVIYSEILDKYMSVLITKRAIGFIHDLQGLDNYLLSTKACDLQTLVSLALKRKLLLALRDNELPYDEEKNNKLYDKYKKWLLPHEEIEWYGLSFTEACKKLKGEEDYEKEASCIPLKKVYRSDLIQELKTKAALKQK